MLNNFQLLVNTILENMNAAGSGGSLGTPQQAIYDPSGGNIQSADRYATGDGRNIFGGILPAKSTRRKGKKGKKSRKGKVKPLVIRRTLQRKAM